MSIQNKKISYYFSHLLQFLTVVILLFSFSCKSSNKTTETARWNLSSIYTPGKSVIHPSYKIFHKSEGSSLLYLKVFVSELLFQPIGPQGSLKSEISVSYNMYKADDITKAIIDSGTYNFPIFKNGIGTYYINQIPVKAETDGSYRLKIIIRDRLRNNYNLSFLDVEKRAGYGEQFFNLTGLDGHPIFKNVLIGNGAFRVVHSNPISDKLFISYYTNKTPLPKPTFAAGSDEFIYEKPDSLYILDYSPNLNISLANQGMYFIQFDTNSNEGVSVTKFDSDFPKITTAENMVEPLAYITTSAEYERLINSENKKLVADNFWIKAGGSADRGRELIRVYYNRVYFANYYFTNTKPGWKTDRGMIYIVYGSPHNLKKSADSEIWYYYIKSDGEEITFKFNYNPNKFNIHQYQLERSENNNWHWREAVYSWTNGEIYLQ